MADGPGPHSPGPAPIEPRKEATGAADSSAVESGNHETKFVCERCGEVTLRVVGVADEEIKVECLTCGKEMTIDRTVSTPPSGKPPAQSP